MLMSQPRIFFSMSRDLLLPPGISKIHPKYGTPYITTIITCIVVALVAGFTRIEVVGEMTSIGTLFAFVVVCAAVMVLRVKRPDVKRPFTAPGGQATPILGVISCAYLMLSLAVLTWVRFLVWLDIGMLIYWFYSRTHSPLFNAELEGKKSSTERSSDFLTMWGGLGLFNGAWITLVGLMTFLGINGEATAKWHEIGISSGQAAAFGAVVLAISAVLFMMGRPKKA
jgi:amino acid transporter